MPLGFLTQHRLYILIAGSPSTSRKATSLSRTDCSLKVVFEYREKTEARA